MAKSLTFLFLLVFAPALASPAVAQNVVYVDAILGDDALGLGTAASPYRTITKGVQSLSSASGPTTVHVAPGTYGVSHGESFPIQLKPSMTVLGQRAEQTYVSGEGGHTLFRLADKSLISDLTVTRSNVAIESTGTGVSVRYVRRCILRDSDVGLYCFDWLHTDVGTVVVNSTIAGNLVGVVAESTGYDFQSVSVLLYGSTVTANGVGIQAFGILERYLGLFDSIVFGNGNDQITGWSSIFPGITGNVLGDPTYVGTNGNIGVDPTLVDPAKADAHLPITSPAIDNAAPPVVWPPDPKWVGANQWVWESTFEEIGDHDGDDRVGVLIDPGADEVVLPTLYIHDRAKLGTNFTMKTQAAPAETVLVYASAAIEPAPVGGFLWLKLPILPVGTLVTDASGIGVLTVPLPATAAFAGLDAYAQAFRMVGTAYEGSAPEWVRLQP